MGEHEGWEVGYLFKHGDRERERERLRWGQEISSSMKPFRNDEKSEYRKRKWVATGKFFETLMQT